MPRIISQRLKAKLSTCSYITSLCCYFLYYKYHDNHKNAGKAEKKCTFSRFGQEKAHKKNLHTNRLAYAEEKIKRKYIICVVLHLESGFERITDPAGLFASQLINLFLLKVETLQCLVRFMPSACDYCFCWHVQ